MSEPTAYRGEAGSRAPATVLSGRDLHRRFGTGAGEVHALAGVSLDVPAGRLTVVRGPSGSGKTTLLNLLGGLDRPTDGSVLLDDGRVLSELAEKDVLAVRRERIGYVFQSFGLVPVLSAAENVEVPLRLQKTPVAERNRRVEEALELVGLARHSRQRPYELSGGQQQRVGIARALVSDPDILIADEPTGQLDSDTGAMIMDLLVQLTHERGIASVVSTHDPILMGRADQVVELHDGARVSSEG
ncbi:ABC transporter ATP-binding protein [Serinicoccus kebangsaanensis]|uniref:ABC transporter ATP-binding protein n=1 Tax=Serinicoccus kebangsaanensis TaxID=2602069 RepID=UPI00124C4BD6|nr:ABC transporter ATP-binding protein [Serinicoccus kebangsaanensis]